MDSILTFNNLLILVILPVAAFIGVIFKTTWDRFSLFAIKQKEEKLKNQREYYENKINKFYLPLYVYLQRDKDLWDLMIRIICKKANIEYSVELYKDTTLILKHFKDLIVEEDNMLKQLDNTILENHIKCLHVIQEYGLLSQPEAYFTDLLSQYCKHTIIYKFLRNDGLIDFPSSYGAEYPSSLLTVVKISLDTLRNDYDKIVCVKK